MNENKKKNTMTSEEKEATFKNALFGSPLTEDQTLISIQLTVVLFFLKPSVSGKDLLIRIITKSSNILRRLFPLLEQKMFRWRIFLIKSRGSSPLLFFS